MKSRAGQRQREEKNRREQIRERVRRKKMQMREKVGKSRFSNELCGRRSTLDRWSGQFAKRIGTRLSALRLTFHFLKEVSQNCFG